MNSGRQKYEPSTIVPKRPVTSPPRTYRSSGQLWNSGPEP